LTEYAPIAVFIGVGLILFAKKRYIKHIGEIIAGFGILFMGMDLMSTSMKPLRDNEAFHNILMQISNPLLGRDRRSGIYRYYTKLLRSHRYFAGFGYARA
jgi:phosphate:Na+ symporter